MNESYKEEISELAYRWVKFGFFSAIFIYLHFLNETSLEMFLRFNLGVLILFQFIKNRGKAQEFNQNNFSAVKRLAVLQFYSLGFYFFAAMVHIYYIWM